MSGELIASNQFMSDMYGCHTTALLTKRMERNPFLRTIPYDLICPELKDLLNWCGPGLYDVKLLPWNKNDVNKVE